MADREVQQLGMTHHSGTAAGRAGFTRYHRIAIAAQCRHQLKQRKGFFL
jgi:hypothetical protein